MTKAKKQDFDHLSGAEKAIVGSPEDYAWDQAIELPARARGESVQFSLRVDREVVIDLQAIARDRGTTFSEVAREALERYVSAGGRPGVSNIQVSFRRDQGMLVQVAGRRAEVSANRRQIPMDERADLGVPASTS